VLFHAVLVPLFGDSDSLIYFLWFICGPFIALACAATMVYVLDRFLPPLARLVSGGRPTSLEKKAQAAGKMVTAN
jgi:hypothetical protein